MMMIILILILKCYDLEIGKIKKYVFKLMFMIFSIFVKLVKLVSK